MLYNMTTTENDDSRPYIAGMTRAEWRARTDAYVAASNAIPAGQRRHEGCDHAYGICSA